MHLKYAQPRWRHTPTYVKDHGTVRPRGFHEACVFALVWSEDDEHAQIDMAQQSVALHSFDVLDRTQFVAKGHNQLLKFPWLSKYRQSHSAELEASTSHVQVRNSNRSQV